MKHCFLLRSLLLASFFEALIADPIIGTKGTKKDDTVCYDELGCFSIGKPWNEFGRRAVLPSPPHKIGTRFLLYTRKSASTQTPQQLIAGNVEALRASHFDGQKPLKFIIHGFNSAGWKPWIKQMALQLLKVEDCNVIVVDWEKGSKALYAHAAANIRVVAAQLQQLLIFFTIQTGLKLENVHFIGHSLGAHMSGYVGTSLRGIGRITGMDPGGPFFEKMNPFIRLDETDANFVDVIHTDADSLINALVLQGGLGIWTPSGHVDYYVNGGLKQPGCGESGTIETIMDEGLINGSLRLVLCNHGRAHDIFTDAIASSCPFRAYICPNWEEFTTGRCLHCPPGDPKFCNKLGYRGEKPNDGSVNNMMWLATSYEKPFCKYHYHIQLFLARNDNKKQKGIVWFNLVGNKGRSGFIAVNDSKGDRFMMEPGSIVDFLFLSPFDLGEKIERIELQWRHDASWFDITQWHFGTPKIYPVKVRAFSGEYQTESTFCDNAKPLETLNTQAFSKVC